MAGADVERRAVPGTRDDAAVDRTLIERAAVMRADVLDCVEVSIDVADQDLRAAEHDAFGRAGYYVGAFCHRIFCHRVHLLDRRRVRLSREPKNGA